MQTLDADAVRRWCTTGLAALRRHEQEINRLNVYPVPDGDTGTNLVLTLAAAARTLAGSGVDGGAGEPAGEALRRAARQALLDARGNSGVILAQFLRGLADGLPPDPVDGAALAAALDTAVKEAYGAVAEPVEGTILSVATAAAKAAAAVAAGGLDAVARAAADAAAEALEHTPEQLPVLAAAGVVDAGGRGLVVLLDALVEVVTGTAPERPAVVEAPRSGESAGRPTCAGVPSDGHGHAPHGPTGVGRYAYEVQYLLEADEESVARLREKLSRLGDSLAVIGTGDGVWNVHVHVDDVGAAVEAGVEAGRPYRISVTRFEEVSTPPDPEARGAVVVADGQGLAALFAREGAVVVSGRPSTAEVLAAIRATRAGQVVVLPNSPDTQAVAAAAADEAAAGGVQVRVVPTRSPVQAMAALAVRDPARRFDDDVIAMAEAAGACRYALVCRASRDALTVVGPCRAGDVLALVDGEVHLVGQDLTAVCTQLLDRMLGGGGELVTLLFGAEAPEGLSETLLGHLRRRWPLVEVHHHDGGQPTYPLVVGVE